LAGSAMQNKNRQDKARDMVWSLLRTRNDSATREG
jgi:hypothetical protein